MIIDIKQKIKHQSLKLESTGTITGIKGSCLIAALPNAAIGDHCTIIKKNGSRLAAEVISFNENNVILAPLAETLGILPNNSVTCHGQALEIEIPQDIKGHVIDALGQSLIGGSNHTTVARINIALRNPAPAALERTAINRQLITGIKQIDLIHPIGYGQRVGILASAGVGKSTLLGMITRNANVDAVIIALIGERGREVNEFINSNLGPQGLTKATLVVSTSDEPPLRRLMAAYSATAIAEHLSKQGQNVLLVVDSLTRIARALREIGLAAGEMPVRQGYTSNVYTELPKLLERAGKGPNGSISAVYTILSSTEQEYDALGDELKSLLDGHLVLDSKLANQGLRPAIDPLLSISRLTERFLSEQELTDRQLILSIFQRLRRDRDIVLLGGSPDHELQVALELEAELLQTLGQSTSEIIDYKLSRAAWYALVEKLKLKINSRK